MDLGFAQLPQDDLSYTFTQLRSTAQPLNGARILITGASGFVGVWLASSLAELRSNQPGLSFDVLVLVRDAETARVRLGDALWNEVIPVVTDVREPWPNLGRITHAIHGATPSSMRSGGSDSRRVLMTAITGTERLIEAIGNQARPPRVLNLSSGAVYGTQPPDVEHMPESWIGGPSPYSPTSPYAEGKRASESLLQQAQREGLLTCVQSRLYAFMGPLLPTNEHFAIGNFVSDAFAGRPILVRGDGSAIRTYLDARDMAIWLLRLLTSGEGQVPYNVGSPTGCSLLEWAEMCAEIVGSRVHVMGERLGDRDRYVPSVEHSVHEGFVPPVAEPRGRIESWLTWLALVQA
jgi:dTDP-glucose 4,6-dehydratase